LTIFGSSNLGRDLHRYFHDIAVLSPTPKIKLKVFDLNKCTQLQPRAPPAVNLLYRPRYSPPPTPRHLWWSFVVSWHEVTTMTWWNWHNSWLLTHNLMICWILQVTLCSGLTWCVVKLNYHFACSPKSIIDTIYKSQYRLSV